MNLYYKIIPNKVTSTKRELKYKETEPALLIVDQHSFRGGVDTNLH